MRHFLLAAMLLAAVPALPAPAVAALSFYTKAGRIDLAVVKREAVAYLERSLKADAYGRKRLAQLGRKVRFVVEDVQHDEANATCTVAVVEDHPDHIVTTWRFTVDPIYKTIFYQDPVSGDDVDLRKALRQRKI